MEMTRHSSSIFNLRDPHIEYIYIYIERQFFIFFLWSNNNNNIYATYHFQHPSANALPGLLCVAWFISLLDYLAHTHTQIPFQICIKAKPYHYRVRSVRHHTDSPIVTQSSPHSALMRFGVSKFNPQRIYNLLVRVEDEVFVCAFF